MGELAGRLGWVPSKVSKLQRGQQRPTVADVTAWAEACGHPEAASDLLDLLAEVEAIHWRWQQRLGRGHASIQEDLDQQVQQARRIRSVQIAVIPGLLQTAGYARHMVTMFRKLQGASLHDAEATVAARMRRQEVLYDPEHTFEFVVTENVLHRRVGGADVMRGQIDRLVQLSALDNITLAILPDDADGLEVFPYQAFLMLDGKVIIEGASGEDRFPAVESAPYERMMDAALADSVTGESARRLLMDAAVRLT